MDLKNGAISAWEVIRCWLRRIDCHCKKVQMCGNRRSCSHSIHKSGIKVFTKRFPKLKNWLDARDLKHIMQNSRVARVSNEEQRYILLRWEACDLIWTTLWWCLLCTLFRLLCTLMCRYPFQARLSSKSGINNIWTVGHMRNVIPVVLKILVNYLIWRSNHQSWFLSFLWV
jgi:hypothetical protein